jgi:lysozyme family protein
MDDVVDKIIDDILVAEGGYTNDKNDAGGETMYGVTVTTAKANGYYGPMKDLPRATAKQIYLNRYWLEPKFDRVAMLSGKVAAELADMGVNMGPRAATVALQECLNLLNRQGKDYVDIKEDGVLGAGTLNVLATLLAKRGEDLLLKALIINRGARYLAIAKNNPVQEDFLVGWITNRVHFKV